MDGKLRQMTALYLTKGEKMLLLYRIGSRVVAPSWCGIGGHLEPEEIGDARAGVLREVREEIGLTEGDMENLTMRYMTLRYTKGEIRCNFYFFAELKDGVNLSMECPEGILEWVPVASVLDRNMPVTAKFMLEHYLREGRYTDILYGGVTTETEAHFTAME
ncbi:MAG: NUDIX domain-containing protein [Ruminococcaceae bacterium]|nr:NUDIX domain-containing protein [Oscillospiraceae bacterium]